MLIDFFHHDYQVVMVTILHMYAICTSLQWTWGKREKIVICLCLDEGWWPFDLLLPKHYFFHCCPPCSSDCHKNQFIVTRIDKKLHLSPLFSFQWPTGCHGNRITSVFGFVFIDCGEHTNHNSLDAKRIILNFIWIFFMIFAWNCFLLIITRL